MKMKAMALTLLGILLLCFLSCAVAAKPLFDITKDDEAVVDTDGDFINPGNRYYIVPFFKGQGGGLTVADTGKCKFDVIQEGTHSSYGLPVVFSPANPADVVVRQPTDVNIKVCLSSSCENSPVWTVNQFDVNTGQYMLGTGGVEGNPGAQTIFNWFKIVRVDHESYKLVYCPSVCDYCQVICKDVNLYVDESGLTRLALSSSDKPHRIIIRKVAG